MSIRRLWSLILVPVLALATQQARAESFIFDDTASNRVTVTVSGFLQQRFQVNGRTFNGSGYSDFSLDFAKGAKLDFTGLYLTGPNGAVTSSKTYLFVDALAPTTVVAELQYNLTKMASSSQQVTGTFWGIGSGRTFTSLANGTALVLGAPTHSYNSTATARAVTFSPSANLLADVAVTRVAIAAVPEPATWAMMIFGMGIVGGAMRSRRKVQLSVRYA